MRPNRALVLIAIGALMEAMVVGAPIAPKKWKPAPKPRATAPISNLQAALNAARRDYAARQRDNFAAASVDSSRQGEPFRIALPIGDGNHGSIFYSYDADNGSIELNISADLIRVKNKSDTGKYEATSINAINLKEVEIFTGSYTASNAYGASARVEILKIDIDSIVLLELPYPNSLGKYYSTKVSASGPKAKQIIADTVAVIEGKLANLPSGQLARCDGWTKSPTFDMPYEERNLQCIVGTKVDRVAFVRKSTGEVIQEWRNDTPTVN